MWTGHVSWSIRLSGSMQLGFVQARRRRRGPAAFSASELIFGFYFPGCSESSALSRNKCNATATTSDIIPHLSQQDCFVHVHAAKSKMSVNQFNRFGCFYTQGMVRMDVCKSASCVCFRVNILLAFSKAFLTCGFQCLCNSRASSQNPIV